MSSESVFSSATTEQLIELVRQYEHLYNRNSKDYTDNRIKEVTWKTIAARLQIANVEDVKKKWKNLRDTFAKLYVKYKTQKLQSQGSPSDSYRSSFKWAYYDQMSFLSDTIRTRKSAQQEGEYFEIVDTGTVAKKRKQEATDDLLATLKTLGHKTGTSSSPPMMLDTTEKMAAEDMHDAFGRSVAAQLRALPESSQAWARFKISEVLFTAATAQTEVQQHQQSLNIASPLYSNDPTSATNEVAKVDVNFMKHEAG